MAYGYTIEKRPGYLLYTTSGDISDVADLLKGVNEVLEVAAEHGYNILLDDRGLVVNLTNMDAILTGDYLNELQVQSRGMRVASIQSPENMAIGRMFETVLVNRSISFRVFEDFESAEAWVTSRTAPRR